MMLSAPRAVVAQTKSYAPIIAPPPPPGLGGHQRKHSLLFGFCAPDFLKNERVFFLGVLPSKYSGRWRGSCKQKVAGVGGNDTFACSPKF